MREVFQSDYHGRETALEMSKTRAVISQEATLRQGVREAYSQAASNPGGQHPFPVGAEFARSLGYAEELLAWAPAESLESFAGVSNVAVFAELPDSSRVVDLGCGSGLDSLVASQRVGPAGRVVGVDFSDAMLSRANTSKRRLGLNNLALIQSAAEQLPLRSSWADSVLVNGIFNLNPFRDLIFQEIARILKPGGTVFGAELVLQAPLDRRERRGAESWFS